MELGDNRKTSNRLREFARTLFESTGGVVELVEDDLIEVLLPKELEERFGTDFLIALDPEIVPEVPSAQLLNYGSALLDDLIAFTEEQGTVSRVYLTGIHLDDSRIKQNLKRTLRFEGSDIQIRRIKVKLFKYLLFTFKIRYTTDEREEEFISVGVNMENGQIARRLINVVSDPQRYSQENYLICPEAESISVYQAYGIAQMEVERKMIASINYHKTAMEKVIHQESTRISKFYQDNDTELQQRIEKENVRRETHVDWTADEHRKSEARIQTLLSKRGVNEIERKRRLKEMLDKYTLRTNVRLINLLEIAYPKLVNTVAVVENGDKKSAGESLRVTTTIIWDPVTQSPEPLICSKCSKLTTTLKLVRPPKDDAQLVCGEC